MTGGDDRPSLRFPCFECNCWADVYVTGDNRCFCLLAFFICACRAGELTALDERRSGRLSVAGGCARFDEATVLDDVFRLELRMPSSRWLLREAVWVF